MILQTIFSLRYRNIIIITLLIVLYRISFKKTLKSLLWIYSLKLAPELLRTFFSFFTKKGYIYTRTTNIISLHKF